MNNHPPATFMRHRASYAQGSLINFACNDARSDSACRLRFQPVLWGGTALVPEWGSSAGRVGDDHQTNDQAAIVAVATL